MKVLLSSEENLTEEITIPESPQIGDEFYRVVGYALCVVYKRDWVRTTSNGWVLTVWVRNLEK